MKRHEVGEEEWAFLDPLIPKSEAKTGRPPRDRRQMLDGILWILSTGAQRRDLPERFGPWETVYGYFRKWRADGLLDSIIDALHLRLDQQGKIDWDLWCIDGTSVRGTRSAAGASKKSTACHPEEPSDHGLGRSRGGFGTKIHLLVDGNGMPLEVEATAGRAHDSKRLEPILKKVHVKQKRVRPKSRPKRLAGDKGYSSETLRRFLKNRGIEPIIPHKDNEKARHDPEVKFDKDAYKRRSIVEQSIGWLKECRRIGTRFEKLAINFLAMIKVAMIKRALRLVFSNRA